MRVLQVATLVSPDGAYGGPVQVALNQCQALQDRGTRAELAAGWRGFPARPRELQGVRLHARRTRTVVPRTGFAGLSSPGLLAWAVTHLRRFDVVHVHLARDLVTLPMARLALALGVPVVVQTHGMIDPSDRRLSAPVDLLMTRTVLHRAGAVFHLTDQEQEGLLQVARAPMVLRPLHNGVPDSGVRGRRSSPPLVLFVGRLHERKRPVAFTAAVLRLAEAGVEADFVLVGPDEGEAAEVEALIASSPTTRVSWRGARTHAEAMELLAGADVFVMPSIREAYPMGVLEAMAQGVPCVVTDGCGLAPEVAEQGCGLVVDGSVESLAEAVRELLADPGARERMGAQARRTAATLHGMEHVTDLLGAAYEQAVGGAGRP